MTNRYNEAYYLRGKETGISNYQNYRWREELTVPACRKIMQYLGARPGESIVDIGAALGFYVKAFRMLGMRAYGVDISQWALENCDPEVRDFMSAVLPRRAFDWATLKDVAEHMALGELRATVRSLNQKISKGMLFIVPLASNVGGKYVRKEDESDVTHIIRWPLTAWLEFLERNAPGFNVNASYDIHGIKPASTTAVHSCGFFTLTRP